MISANKAALATFIFKIKCLCIHRIIKSSCKHTVLQKIYIISFVWIDTNKQPHRDISPSRQSYMTSDVNVEIEVMSSWLTYVEPYMTVTQIRKENVRVRMLFFVSAVVNLIWVTCSVNTAFNIKIWTGWKVLCPINTAAARSVVWTLKVITQHCVITLRCFHTEIP